jgi:hypothetical protein
LPIEILDIILINIYAFVAAVGENNIGKFESDHVKYFTHKCKGKGSHYNRQLMPRG